MRPARLALVSLSLLLAACAPRRAPEPVTVELLDIGPWHQREYAEWGNRALADFTRETGVVVKRVAAPEAADEQLVLERQLLEGGAPTPDVYIIDAIWPGILAEHLLDLRPHLAAEAAQHFPALVANNEVAGRLVAMPYHANVGVLFFRTDLLREYGYAAPPETWQALGDDGGTHPEGRAREGPRRFLGIRLAGSTLRGPHLQCPRMAGLGGRGAHRRRRRNDLRQQRARDQGLGKGGGLGRRHLSAGGDRLPRGGGGEGVAGGQCGVHAELAVVLHAEPGPRLVGPGSLRRGLRARRVLRPRGRARRERARRIAILLATSTSRSPW